MAARIYLFIIIFGVCGSIGYAGYSYYVQMQEKVIQLSKNNSKLKIAIETSEASISALQQQNKKNTELAKELQIKLQKAEDYSKQLQNTLKKHNLTMLALKKSTLIEKKMNDATNKLWDDITNDTNINVVQ